MSLLEVQRLVAVRFDSAELVHGWFDRHLQNNLLFHLLLFLKPLCPAGIEPFLADLRINEAALLCLSSSIVTRQLL